MPGAVARVAAVLIVAAAGCRGPGGDATDRTRIQWGRAAEAEIAARRDAVVEREETVTDGVRTVKERYRDGSLSVVGSGPRRNWVTFWPPGSVTPSPGPSATAR